MWGEALNTVCHIQKRVPLKHMDKTPYELWRKRRTSLSYLRVWGCLAKVLFPEHKRKKLGPKTVDCIFLGYLETTTAMRFLVLKSDIDGIVANTIVEFRDATFYEEVFPMKTGISLGSSEDDPTHTSSSIPDHVEKMTNVGVDPGSSSTPNKVEEPRRSKRAKVVKDFGSDFITYNVEDEPLTFRQAKDSSESRHWKGAVKSEIDSIVSNGTWELVDLPPGCSTIGCKWIFKRKLNPDGSINKYKARLVAKGFRQREGIDYFDTYSPVARMTTIRMLIALASVHGLIIHQMDVMTAFLHGYLEEEIYMDQPEGFVASDDILLFGTNIEIINETKSFLKMHFEMKDMGEASVILGIKLTQSTDGITLSQSHYIKKSILEKYGYSNCRIASTPYDSKVALVKNSSGVSVSQLRQTLITRSTFEAELCALDAMGTEAEWLHGLMSMLPVVSKPLPAIFVHCDSRTTIDKVGSVKYNAKTKRHIQVRLKSIRGLVSDRIIAIEFIGTEDNIADPLTKGIEHAIVLKSRLGMGLAQSQTNQQQPSAPWPQAPEQASLFWPNPEQNPEGQNPEHPSPSSPQAELALDQQQDDN
ncbi:hypothetical protein AgCh_017506 [Apium graveolens]